MARFAVLMAIIVACSLAISLSARAPLLPAEPAATSVAVPVVPADVVATTTTEFTPSFSDTTVSDATVPQQPRDIPAPDIVARAAAVVFFDKDGEEEILFEKDSGTSYPIASITKLMTAIVASKLYFPDRIISVSHSAASKPRASFQSDIAAGASFTADALSRLMLVESNNAAAAALAEANRWDDFVDKMNSEARDLGLAQTRFANPTGIDPANGEPNASSAGDLIKLMQTIYERYPKTLAILGRAGDEVYDSEGNLYIIASTNDLLRDAAWRGTVVGGKTGETDRAGQTLLFASLCPRGSGHIVTALLGSSDRFGDARKVLRWVQDFYSEEE